MKLFLLSAATMLLISCSKQSGNDADSYLMGDGAFIINEGNFMSGNGSLSFFSYDSLEVYNDLFDNINGRPLGDVPNSIAISGNKAYLVVNNSGRIEVVDKYSLKSIATIRDLDSPRNIAVLSGNKAYVSSMFSDSLAILNLSDNSISGYINLRRSSESLEIASGKLFAASWIAGDEVMVVDTRTDKVIDSVKVGIEPESMVVDKFQKLWVLCNGGWTRQNYAKLISVNTGNNRVEKEFVFPTKAASPSCLKISGDGSVLFYLEGGVRKMNADAAQLPSVAFIAETGGTFFYRFGVNPLNGDIMISDAVDYQKAGNVVIYEKDGTLIKKMGAGIIPGMICFRIN